MLASEVLVLAFLRIAQSQKCSKLLMRTDRCLLEMNIERERERFYEYMGGLTSATKAGAKLAHQTW